MKKAILLSLALVSSVEPLRSVFSWSSMATFADRNRSWPSSRLAGTTHGLQKRTYAYDGRIWSQARTGRSVFDHSSSWPPPNYDSQGHHSPRRQNFLMTPPIARVMPQGSSFSSSHSSHSNEAPSPQGHPPPPFRNFHLRASPRSGDTPRHPALERQPIAGDLDRARTNGRAEGDLAFFSKPDFPQLESQGSSVLGAVKKQGWKRGGLGTDSSIQPSEKNTPLGTPRHTPLHTPSGPEDSVGTDERHKRSLKQPHWPNESSET